MLGPDEMKAKLKAGQAETITGLRALADRIEALSLRDAAEVLSWLRGPLDELHRQAGIILRAVETGTYPVGSE